MDNRHINYLAGLLEQEYTETDRKVLVWDTLYDMLAALPSQDLARRYEQARQEHCKYLVYFRHPVRGPDELIGWTDSLADAETYIEGDETEFYIVKAPALGVRED